VSDKQVQMVNWSIVNPNPCIGEHPSEGLIIETGEMVRIEVKSLAEKPFEFRAVVRIDARGKLEVLHFDTVILQPGEVMTLTTPPFTEEKGRDGSILGILTNLDPIDFVASTRKPYSKPKLERFEFTLQPGFFAAGGDAIRTVLERSPDCHTDCMWNAVTSFLLGAILPHYDNNEKLKRAATVIIPRIIELQAIATSEDPVEFANSKHLKVFVDDIHVKGSGNAKHN